MASIEQLTQLANQGDSGAQFQLSLMYERGDSVEKSIATALAYAERAAQAGDCRAMLQSALLRLNYEEYRDYGKAMDFLMQAYKSDNEEIKNMALPYLGTLINVKEAFDGDEKARRVLKENLEHMPECLIEIVNAAIHQGGGAALFQKFQDVLKDDNASYSDAHIYLQQAAEAGYAPALAVLGLHYNDGFGVEQNDAKAVALLEKAMQGDDDIAPLPKFVLAKHHLFGRGTPENTYRAVQLINEAISDNYGPAITFLALMYNDGIGVPKDDRKVVELFEKALSLGIELSPLEKGTLGEHYLEGNGTSKNPYLAEKYLSEAADAGDLDALIHCAAEYRFGQNFTHNVAKSDRYCAMMASSDEPRGIYMAGMCYAAGVGDALQGKMIRSDAEIDSDIEQALTYLQRATYVSDPTVAEEARKMLQSVQNIKRDRLARQANARWKEASQTSTPSSTSGSSSTSSKGCYIATAVYGSYNCPEVWTLRRFRDYKLAQYWGGRLFIKVYYAISPSLVRYFGKTKTFNHFWRYILNRMVESLHNQGYMDTPYDDTTMR